MKSNVRHLCLVVSIPLAFSLLFSLLCASYEEQVFKWFMVQQVMTMEFVVISVLFLSKIFDAQGLPSKVLYFSSLVLGVAFVFWVSALLGTPQLSFYVVMSGVISTCLTSMVLPVLNHLKMFRSSSFV